MVQIKLKCSVKFDEKKLLKRMVHKAEQAHLYVANLLIEDSKAFIPILTGQLRDSGRTIRNKSTEISIIWEAYSPENFNYAEVQYYKELQHIDGFYAARWAERAISESGHIYKTLLEMITSRAFV